MRKKGSSPNPMADRRAWVGSMRDSMEITGDIFAPANEATEWEVLDDDSPEQRRAQPDESE
jgi:hypothetical protein